MGSGITIVKVDCSIKKPFEELGGSPSFQVSDRGLRGRRELKCLWDDAVAIAGEMKGWTQQTDKDGKAFIRHRPHRFPLDDRMFCESVSIKPFVESPVGATGLPSTTAQAEYEYAKLDVEYDLKVSDPANPDDEPLVSERFEPAVEFVSVPRKAFIWSGIGDAGMSGKPLTADSVIGKYVRLENWIYTMEKLPTIPKEMRSLSGCVNNCVIRSTRHDAVFATGSLLYGTPQFTPQFTYKGVQLWKAEIKLTHRYYPWLVEADPNNPVLGADSWNRFATSSIDAHGDLKFDWIRMTGDPTGPTVRVYPYGDFTKIISG